MKLSKRIFAGITFTTLVTVLLTSVLIITLMYNIMSKEIRQQVKTEAQYISSLQDLSENEIDLKEIGNIGENRITVISGNGTVKYDNLSDYADMENHSDRPEVKQALQSGSGESIRTSTTFGKETYYYAVKLKNGDVVRVASETSSMFGIVTKALPGILFSILILLAIAMAVAGFLTNNIIGPVNKLDVDDPLNTKTYDELSPLLVKIDRQNKEMTKQITTIYENRRENEYITENMHDGLVIINTDGNVISANKAAENVFGFKRDNEPQSYLEICREPLYRTAIQNALLGKSADTTIERDGRIYRISASSVNKNFKKDKSGKDVYAVVMFVHDVTEREEAEKMRREFSANVSHELKTPLTSIMGCSEIMKAGIAKPEDTPRFLNQINSEAKRLLALIDDIIRLSSLDENSVNIEMSEVDISSVCNDVCTELKSKADEQEITLESDLKPVKINGNARLLHEMIYNLVDNSIRYNKPGGSVKLSAVETEQGKAFISVKDNGIGIAKEEQDRVFERFYRVDKSHSKETGGTGLGLSIVKHAAIIHGGKITLSSEPGKGTEIKIEFND